VSEPGPAWARRSQVGRAYFWFPMTEYLLPMRECKLGPLALILSDLSCRLAVAVARGNGVSFDMQKECDSWCETWLS
jgi:hypothetical protein